MRISGLAATLSLLAATLAHAPSSAQSTDVSVLIDFGDGTYEWADVATIPENRTALRATEIASEQLRLPAPEVRWFDSSFCIRKPCALVEDIGNRDPVSPAWWHFYLWNASGGTWEFSAVGPSDVEVSGQSIAWYLAVDDPNTYAAPLPIPTPTFRDVWTSFRGDRWNRGLAHGAIPRSGVVLWDHDLGVLEIDTTPVAAYGRVFVGTRNGLFALDAVTGQEVWRNPQVRTLLSTPAVYDGKLIVGGTDGKLHALDAATGDLLWSVVLETGRISTGIASSPTIHEGRAYVGVFNEDPGGMGAIVALNLNNWTVAWRYETASVHMSQPAIADGIVYAGLMGVYDGSIGFAPPYGVLALNLNGTFNRFLATSGGIASSPVVAGSRVFATSKDGNLYAFDSAGEVWRHTIGPSTSSPALVGDRLYAGSGALEGSGRLYAFTLDGGEIWNVSIGGAVQASVVADGALVCAATNVPQGKHLCVNASDGSPVWSHTPTPNQYILGSSIVVGTTMFAVSDNGHVYALGQVSLGAASPLVLLGSLGLIAVVVIGVIAIAWYRRRRGRDHA